ncbi:hypothetical protein MKW92_022682 [Papaver armeniacum]|nr:hypothetical protein MKW92_022682 [Papaver armeniacum]
MRKTIFSEIVVFLFLLVIQSFAESKDYDNDIYYNGFNTAYLTTDHSGHVADNGLLQLTDHKRPNEQGHAFFSRPFQFKSNLSFHTTFVFAIASESSPRGQGLAFVIAPQRELPGALENQFLGLFNATSNGNSANHVFAVELDIIYNVEFDDVPGPHVGIDINNLKSVNSTAPAYFINGEYKKLNYDGIDKQVRVTLAPINVSKPNVPLLVYSKDLSTIFLDSMYVGFSASTQTVQTSHYILGWSFQINGKARALNLSSLSTLPPPPSTPSPPPPPSPSNNKSDFDNNCIGNRWLNSNSGIIGDLRILLFTKTEQK